MQKHQKNPFTIKRHSKASNCSERSNSEIGLNDDPEVEKRREAFLKIQ